MDTPEARLNQYLDQMEAAVRGGDEVGDVDVTQIADDIDSLLNPEVADEHGGRFEMGTDLPGRAQAEPEQAEPEQETEEAAGEEEQEKAEAESAEGEEGEEPFVEAADGKARIPYSVLQSERARRQELEARLRALEEGSQEGRREESGEPDDGGEGEQADHRSSIDARIEAIKDLVPDEVAELLASMGEALKASDERSRFYEERELEREQSARESRLNTVQEAIDAIPTLAEWQAADGDEWAEAVALDSALRALPKYAQMPHQERFKEVVRRMGGQLEEAASSTSKAGDGGGRRPAPPTPREVHPTTLSDIPGGTPPDQSERDTIDKSDVSELYAQMERMTPDQITALLARVA